jgi:hypothetical protein
MADENDSKMPRRTFIKLTAAGAAAVGVASIVPSAFAGGITEQPTSTPTPQSGTQGQAVALTGPVVAFISDPTKDEISIMNGDMEFVVNDHALVNLLTKVKVKG